MGFINWLKKKIGKENTSDLTNDSQSSALPTLPEIKPSRKKIEMLCELCNREIGFERYKKTNGHLFHKNCFKHAQRRMVGYA